MFYIFKFYYTLLNLQHTIYPGIPYEIRTPRVKEWNIKPLYCAPRINLWETNSQFFLHKPQKSSNSTAIGRRSRKLFQLRSTSVGADEWSERLSLTSDCRSTFRWIRISRSLLVPDMSLTPAISFLAGRNDARRVSIGKWIFAFHPLRARLVFGF